jgi:hypothetical protein
MEQYRKAWYNRNATEQTSRWRQNSKLATPSHSRLVYATIVWGATYPLSKQSFVLKAFLNMVIRTVVLSIDARARNFIERACDDSLTHPLFSISTHPNLHSL